MTLGSPFFTGWQMTSVSSSQLTASDAIRAAVAQHTSPRRARTPAPHVN